MMLDKNGREIKIGDKVRRGIMVGGILHADENGHLPIDSMRVLSFAGDRNIVTDVRSNSLLPPVYLASLCEVID